MNHACLPKVMARQKVFAKEASALFSIIPESDGEWP